MRALHTEATHGVATDPTGLLRGAGAPADLIAWAEGRPADELWDECDRGDWLIWLAAVERVPVVGIVEAALASARHAARSLPKGPARRVIASALRAAKELRSSALCAQRAEACEKLAGQPAAPAYRSQPRSRLEHAAASAGAAARAAEALLAAESRRSGKRDYEGRLRAAAVGVGDQIISRGDFPPFVLDPEDELIAVSMGSAEAAIGEAALTLAPPDARPDALEAVEGELSEVVFAILDPIRAGLRQGRPARELVRAVDVEPYGSTLATRNAGGAELAEDLTQSKRATVAMAAGLVFPVGGAAHHYAGHATLGWLLTAGGIGAIAGLVTGLVSVYAWLVIVAADIALAPSAVALHNAGTPTPVSRQVAYGLGILGLAMLAGQP